MTDLIKRLETIVNKKRIDEISQDTIEQLFSLTEYVYENTNNLNDGHFAHLDACLESLKDLGKKESVIDLFKGLYERRSAFTKDIMFFVLYFFVAVLMVKVVDISLFPVPNEYALMIIVMLGLGMYGYFRKHIVR